MRLWHGGVPGLRVGDLVVPGERHYEDGCPVCAAKAEGRNFTVGGVVVDPLNVHEDRVYVTSDREYARFYASKYPLGDLYRVEPVWRLGDMSPLVDVGTEDPFPTWAAPAARVEAVYERAVRLTHRQRVTLLERWRQVDRARQGLGVNRLRSARARIPRL